MSWIRQQREKCLEGKVQFRAKDTREFFILERPAASSKTDLSPYLLYFAPTLDIFCIVQAVHFFINYIHCSICYLYCKKTLVNLNLISL